MGTVTAPLPFSSEPFSTVALEISQQCWVWLLVLTGIPFHDIPISLQPSTVHELTHMNSLRA